MSNSQSKDEIERLERTIRGIHFGLVRLTRPLLGEYGLTTPRFHLLLALERRGPLGMGDIASQIHVGGSTATALADGLESDGYLERYRTGDDRRKVFLRITRRGSECIAAIRTRRGEILRETLAGVSAATRELLTSELEAVHERLSDMKPSSGACT